MMQQYSCNDITSAGSRGWGDLDLAQEESGVGIFSAGT